MKALDLEFLPAPSHSSRLAVQAVDALLDEARLTPKPGLVDRRGRGAHTDLDLELMCRSACALAPAFIEMAEVARDAGAPTLGLRESLGRIGREAEAAMMQTTQGVNTHRGAIWALGLLVAGAALESEATSPARTAQLAAAIARMPDCHAPQVTGNKGERACRDFGVTGARGQAQAGFPQVIERGLPELQRSRARGNSETASRLNALLAILSGLDDTCVLSRAGPAALRALQDDAADVLAGGGVASLTGRRLLHQLDARALALNASPGGAADLLAATLFLDRLDLPVCRPSLN
ncbi:MULTISPECIES: triphosphoribosyl-dephospho-CoA synthase [unclassified Polaromonas]|uniref:triphosphoribosyl-dephospho-CoA synthase n=1 Tax=unclassified Polaromonas TaxID=2638319 RepID=UPI0018CAA247|nr:MULTISPECIES: triphosphoribosyl-dephospho-CoA synthase [unclassified Polaromonas]MBG6071649.1 triphosphoribosyl-dephospho-CoA synthase [Polaromonas sp. CG_9.7]MBG6113650.1 triphosphoribosyl-dephospho-CoA synthase [Polaromonas sp. CG_9.2]MDH6184452.1 triphosphoribosyl-dephospho-CoA synthase [Polaromonas sp. CG_23.6]